MIVYINGKFLCQRLTGVQRFAREIVLGIDRQKEKWGDIEFRLVAPSEGFDNDYKLENIPITLLKGGPSYWWEQITLPRFFKKNKGDALLSLCNVAPLKTGKKNIVCIHDLAVIYHPETYSKKFVTVYRFLYKNEAKKAKALLTVTEFSKKQICDYYHVDPERVLVVSNAVNDGFGAGDYPIKEEVKSLISKPFFFSVGSASKNKNMRYVWECAKKYPEFVFAISGEANKVFGSVESYEPLPNLVHLGYLNDGELRFLYSHCKGFIFPSFYEGFGIPPLEAISCGCKTLIASDIPVLHEVLGRFDVNYINPEDYENLIDLRGKLIENSCKDLGYSWDLSAEALINKIQN